MRPAPEQTLTPFPMVGRFVTEVDEVNADRFASRPFALTVSGHWGNRFLARLPCFVLHSPVVSDQNRPPFALRVCQ